MPRVRINRDRRGRPDEYNPEYARMAQAHCRLGATDDDLADLFGVSTSTIRNWISRHRAFAEAVSAGMLQVFSPRVVRSLAQRAIGYVVDTVENKVMRDGSIVRYGVRKHYPPDVTACIFWLKNRMPEDWKDVQDHVIKNNNLDRVTSAELLAEIRREAQELGILPQNLPRGVAGGDSRNGTRH